MSTPADWFNFPTGKIATGAYCDECGRYNARHCTCTGMVINAEGNVLLTKRLRDPQAGYWCMPGGYVDWDETVAECAAREIAEEVGLVVDPEMMELVGIFSDPQRDLDGRQNIDCCFVVKVDEAKLVLHPEEVGEAAWFALSDLPEKMAFDHRQMIEKYQSKKIP